MLKNCVNTIVSDRQMLMQSSPSGCWANLNAKLKLQRDKNKWVFAVAAMIFESYMVYTITWDHIPVVDAF